MVRIAALLALLLAAACGGAAAGGGPAPFTLSVAAPAAAGVAPGRAADPAPPRALVVRIREVDNPDLEPFGVVVTLDATGAEIGRFYVHPPDRTGEHVIALDPDAAEALAAGVTFRLDPLADAPAPFSVTLEADLSR